MPSKTPIICNPCPYEEQVFLREKRGGLGGLENKQKWRHNLMTHVMTQIDKAKPKRPLRKIASSKTHFILQ